MTNTTFLAQTLSGLSRRLHDTRSSRRRGRPAKHRFQGAAESDLPDLFYYRNRVPNWLGAIRGIKSFERQPVVPLGVPALLRLAFRLTAEERRTELLHYLIIRRCAPELLPFPLSWKGKLAFRVGDWSRALTSADEALQLALATQDTPSTSLTVEASFATWTRSSVPS